MRTVLLGGLLIVLLGCPSSGSASRLQVTGPAIRVDPGLIDLGVMAQETVERTQSWIHSIGTDTLRIVQIDSDCGCAVANVPRMVLAPGDSMELKISFNSRHYSGDLMKRVTVVSNDPGAPRSHIKLKVHVKPLAVVEPEFIDFGFLPRGKTVSRTLTLKAAREDSLRLHQVHLPENTFTHEVRPIEDADSTGYELEIHVRSDAPLGNIRARAGLENNCTQRPIQVAIQGTVHGFFLPRPNRISFGQFKAGVIKTVTLRLEAQMQGAHQVKSVSFSQPGLTAQVTPVEPGRVYEIAITATPELPPGQLREEMRIETDDPTQPEIIVAIRGNIKEI